MNTETTVYFLTDVWDGTYTPIDYSDLRPGWNLPFTHFAARTYYSDSGYSLVIL